MRIHVLSLVVAVLTAATASNAGPVASAVLSLKDNIGAGPYDIIQGVGNSSTAVLDNGNFVLYVRTVNVLNSVQTEHIWGSLGGPPAILRSEQPSLAGWTQTGFDSSVSLDAAGRLAYSARLQNPAPPPVSFDSIWVDDTPIAVEDTAFTAGSLSGYWNFHAGPTFTPDGTLYWRSGYAAVPGASSDDGNAIFRYDGASLTTLLNSGDAISGTTETVDFGDYAIHGNWVLSYSGLHSMTVVRLNPSGVEALVIDGALATTASGAPIRIGEPIPIADGGIAGESWDDLYRWAIGDDGQWILSAPIAPSRDDAITINGVVRYREGQAVDGHPLQSIPETVDNNDLGDWAFIWNDGLVLNGRLLLQPGDLIDQNPVDGIPDTPMTSLAAIKLTVANRRQGQVDLYFQATSAWDTSIVRMSVVDAGNIGTCLSGPIEAPGFAAPSDRCLLAYDMPPADGDVDLADYAAFQAMFAN